MKMAQHWLGIVGKDYSKREQVTGLVLGIAKWEALCLWFEELQTALFSKCI